MYWIIDRFEGEVCVLESDRRERRQVPRAALPAGAREGDALTESADGYRLDKRETEVRAERIRRKREALRKK